MRIGLSGLMTLLPLPVTSVECVWSLGVMRGGGPKLEGMGSGVLSLDLVFLGGLSLHLNHLIA